MIPDIPTSEYRCPGETYTISRAIHLGRLASFYPACRDCPRCDDTRGLSVRQVRQLAEVGSFRSQQRPQFYAEGIGSLAVSDLDEDSVRRAGVEFGRRISRGRSAIGPANEVSKLPAVVIAGDGRLASGSIIAAIVEGVRWTGTEVIDIGPASAPCTTRAIEHLVAEGGIFVGQAGDATHTAGLKFWGHGEPLSQGGILDDIAAAMRAGASGATIDRPTRKFGPLRRFSAAEIYLSDLRLAYHALRPLRFVLDCTTGPIVGYLEELMKNVACRVIPRESESGTMGCQVLAAKAHFGIRIHDDGENCLVFDENGHSVEAQRLLALIAGNAAGHVLQGEDLRQKTFQRIREIGSAMASDPAGRIWYASGGIPVPDALRTLTLLLVLLSRNDRAFSAVLDQDAPAV